MLYFRSMLVSLVLLILALAWAATPSRGAAVISFGAPNQIESNQGIASLAVGDFNRDGRDDVAAISGDFKGNATPLLHWYAGPSMTKRVLNSNFYPNGLNEFPGAADSADIDGDGDLDVILGNARHGGGGEGEILWLENPGGAATGNWPVHVAASFAKNAGHMNDIDIDDIDGDGKLDIVMRHLGRAETLRIVFQDNARADQWTVRSIGDLPSREGMGVADLDSDGDPDIMLNGYWLETPNNPRSEPFTQRTLDDTYFTQPSKGLNNSTKQAFGDINGDGKTDVVLSTAEGEQGWLAWYAQPNSPRTAAWPRVRLRTAKALHTLWLADFDNDGDLDILAGGAASLGESGISIWENQNNGQNFVERVVDSKLSAYTGRPFDADGDGDLDIVAQNHCCKDNGDLYWIENLLVDDGTPIPPTNTPLPPTATPIPPTSTPVLPTDTPPPGSTNTPNPPTNTPPPASACANSPTVLYTFGEGSGSTVADVSGSGAPLNLNINSGGTGWLPGGGLAVASSARIESAGPATKLINAAQASDELTVELWIEPANVTQDGPARIVTLAQNGASRNFTVGQGRWASQPKDVFDVRLRTSDGSTNNDGKPAVTSPVGSAKAALTHVVYSRNANGSVTIYVDGVATITESRPGTLDNWDDGYRLGLANEFSSDRPWLGTFYEVGLFNCAFSAGDAASSFSAGVGGTPPTPPTPQPTAAPTNTSVAPTNTPPPSATNTPVPPTNTPPPASACANSPTVLYTFGEGSGSTVADVSGSGAPLNLNINSGGTSWLPGRGLAVTSAARIESAGPATKLIDAAQASDELTIELWIEPANVTQDGPARIVTLAQDGAKRNFTFAQGRWGNQPKDVFDVRLRTSDSSTNDDGKPAVTSPSGTAEAALTHVVYSRDASGSVTIYVDGVAVVSANRSGTLDNWDGGYRLGLANEFNSDRAWLGAFYEVALFDCAFSDVDAAASFSAGVDNASALRLDTTPIEGAVSGNLFVDENSNGMWDESEAGLPNASVTLTQIGGGNGRTAATDEAGAYYFAGVTEPGTYMLSATLPSGYAVANSAVMEFAMDGATHFSPSALAIVREGASGTIPGALDESLFLPLVNR